jgi:hypothetical protein
MKYVCLCYDEEAKLNAMSKAERDAVEKEVCTYNDELRRKGKLLPVQALQSVETATTVRVRNGKLSTTDGHSPKRRNNSATSSLSMRMTWTKPFRSPPDCRARTSAASKSGRPESCMDEMTESPMPAMWMSGIE